MALKEDSAALRYHEATKHSELSLRMSAHYLDWENKPSPFKIYNTLPSIPLPHHFLQPTQPSLKAISHQSTSRDDQAPGFEEATELLFFSAGLTRKMRMGSESYYMRAASATGALYPTELYLISTGVEGLDPGVYHFNPLEFSLVQLRKGDYGSELASMTDQATSFSPLTIVLTSLAWRNSWKYEERSYRHWFWDSGVIAANLLAACSSEGLATKLVMSFIDTEMDRLLGLKPRKEASIALAPIGAGTKNRAEPSRKIIPQIDPAHAPQSGSEVDYPIIWETNNASQLHSQSEVKTWRMSLHTRGSRPREVLSTRPLKPSREDSPSLASVILQRGSTREFLQRPISFEALSTIIDASSSSIPLDFLPDGESLVEFYFIANSVDGLPSGSYHFNRTNQSLEQLKQGRFRDVSGYLCLGQLLFSDASTVFFLMSDLNRTLGSLGDRGYRAAQFEAGVRAGKIYLSSYALGIGASGSTFFDDAVTEFFSPHAEKMSTMIAVGVGVPAYKARPGRILPQFQSHTGN